MDMSISQTDMINIRRSAKLGRKEIERFHRSTSLVVYRVKKILEKINIFKKNKNIKSISQFAIMFVCFGLLISSIEVAYSDSGFTLGLGGLAAIQNTNISRSGQTLALDTSPIFGGGVTSELLITEQFSLEADVFYLSRRFSSNTAEFFGSRVNSTILSGSLQVPIMVRFHPMPILTLGLGGYYSRVVSSWVVSAGGFDSKSLDFGSDDVGVMLALGVIVPVGESMSIVGDVRYAKSLLDLDSSTQNTLSVADVQIYSGVRFNFK
jgi:hypothetical protein